MEATSKPAPAPAYLPFALLWVGANMVGQLVGIGIMVGISEIFLWNNHSGWIGVPLCGSIPATGAVAGGLVGLLQWAVLRQYGWQFQAQAWVRCTAVGGAVAWLVGAVVGLILGLSTDFVNIVLWGL